MFTVYYTFLIVFLTGYRRSVQFTSLDGNLYELAHSQQFATIRNIRNNS